MTIAPRPAPHEVATITALQGAIIQRVSVDADGQVILTLKRGNSMYAVAVQSDAEGNGPGHLAVYRGCFGSYIGGMGGR